MNILKLFSREVTVENATAGTDDVLAELEAEKKRQREAEAARITRERERTAEFRAKNAKTLADFMSRLRPNTQEVNAHIVGLVLALVDTQKLVLEAANVPFDGSVKTLDEVLGFPLDLPDKIIAAIREGAPQTEWSWSGEGQPKLRGAIEVRVPTFAGDAARTYNVSLGQYPPERPIDGEGTTATFLPFAK